jgi:hypothetical protein
VDPKYASRILLSNTSPGYDLSLLIFHSVHVHLHMKHVWLWDLGLVNASLFFKLCGFDHISTIGPGVSGSAPAAHMLAAYMGSSEKSSGLLLVVQPSWCEQPRNAYLLSVATVYYMTGCI